MVFYYKELSYCNYGMINYSIERPVLIKRRPGIEFRREPLGECRNEMPGRREIITGLEISN